MCCLLVSHIEFTPYCVAFSVLTLLVGWQEGHPHLACKKLDWWGAGMLICLGEVQIYISFWHQLT